MYIEVNDIAFPLWPLALLILSAMLYLHWHRHHDRRSLLVRLVFGFYLILMINLVFFPLAVSGDYVNMMRSLPLMARSNWVPFFLEDYPPSSYAIAGMIGNFLLTLPFGLGVNFLKPGSKFNILWAVFLPGLGLESAQLLLRLVLRYPYRALDINDVIFNFSGALLGFLLYLGISNLYRNLHKHKTK